MEGRASRPPSQIQDPRYKIKVDSLLGQVLTRSCHAIMRPRAAERRKIYCLGREPQDTDEKKSGSRGAATDTLGRRMRITPQHRSVGPFGGFHFLPFSSWGSRPRLGICRASGASLHLSLSGWRRSIIRCQLISGRHRWVDLVSRILSPFDALHSLGPI